jgi:hypothetical protein
MASYSKHLPSIEKPEDLLKAWEAGADFRIPNGPYCSVRDLESLREMFLDEYGFKILLHCRNKRGQFQYPA